MNVLLKSIGLGLANKILVSSEKIIGAEVLFIILLGHFLIKERVEVPKQNLVALHVLLYPNLKLYYISHCHYISLFYNICYPDKIYTVENPCH